jgi:hypothetical protein
MNDIIAKELSLGDFQSEAQPPVETTAFVERPDHCARNAALDKQFSRRLSELGKRGTTFLGGKQPTGLMLLR